MFQITPCVNTACSYNAMSLPRASGEPLRQDHVRGTISFKHTVRRKRLRDSFLAYFFQSLPKCQGFRLSKHIGHQDVVVRNQWIQGFGKCDEIAGDQACSLVNELVERVL